MYGVSTAGLLHMSLMVVMLTWQPSPDTLYVTFIITGLWGIADGVWFTQIISKYDLITGA